MGSRKPPPHQDLSGFLQVMAAFSPEVGGIAMTARMLVFDLFPDTHEIVWLQQKNIGYGVGPKKQTDHFVWIMPAAKHVTFGFNYGAELPDPDELLEGVGKSFRHVKLRNVDDVSRPAFKKLVLAAIRDRVAAANGAAASSRAAAKNEATTKRAAKKSATKKMPTARR